MNQVVGQIRLLWARSKAYRVILVIAVVYTVFRLAVHGGYLAFMLSPGLGDLPEWVDVKRPMVPADLQVYLNAARHFRQKESLYLQGSLTRLEDHYLYAPSFALAFMPFLRLSIPAVAIVHLLLHVVAYVLLYIRWERMFDELNLNQAREKLVWTLPVWLLFSSFWTDLGYSNIYLIMTLIGTFFIEAILKEQLGKALLWLSVILQVKPHWAFAAAVPLLLGRYRFFFKLVGLALVAYFTIAGVTILIAGPEYGWKQYAEYVRFLARLSRDFPWRGPNDGFLGYNHSIKQIVVYLFGVSPGMLRLGTAIKGLLLVPLVLVCLSYLLHPLGRTGLNVPRIALNLAFVLYLGAFIWLDMVWEVSLGIAIFPYLLGNLERRFIKVLVSVTFLPYALLDPLRVSSLILPLFGVEVIAPGPYILTDPNIYVPLMMIVILTFYVILIGRLWNAAPVLQKHQARG